MGASDHPIAVLGAGAWGTALAILSARLGNETLLWERNKAVAVILGSDRINNRYLPDVVFPSALTVTDDLEYCIKTASQVLVAIPSIGFVQLIERLKPLLSQAQGIAWATKGLEHGQGRLLNEVVAQTLGADFPAAVLSGPSFALEVARDNPTAVTLAANDEALASRWVERLHSEFFRIYTSHDLPGVCLGGAYKNVLAIAAGISDGLAFGHNARAALITRGLAEMMRLGLKMGGRAETFMGLAGLGDLVLTCTGDLSRNRRLGIKLAEGMPLDKATESIGQVTEGVDTARVLAELGRGYHEELPIADQVYQVLFEKVSPRAAVHALMSRELRTED
ncbi:MAG: NAD(P)H-dependent glycerol-3-phosphate dehydrogenase [Gammaproteobacteria bacterium]|nr:MAG: NAD(P)H-dependent glycerol-3-phosphate dehydrogenase [Gammaproteobacteria bacterium]